MEGSGNGGDGNAETFRDSGRIQGGSLFALEEMKDAVGQLAGGGHRFQVIMIPRFDEYTIRSNGVGTPREGGGLADVMAALPQALVEAGHGVSLVVPLHRGLRRSGEFRQTEREIEVPGVEGVKGVRVWEGERGGVVLFGLEMDEYFDREGVYGEGGVDYPDSLVRFQFLARGAVELARFVEPTPDVIQVNDWHVGLVPAYVKALGLPIRTVCTVHNLGYQGEFSHTDFEKVGTSRGCVSARGVGVLWEDEFSERGHCDGGCGDDCESELRAGDSG